VRNLAHAVGIDPGMAEKAIAALGQSHQMQGDTVELASAKTGLDTDVLSKIVQQIGGEGSLTEFSNMLKDNPQAKGILDMLDRDGDGNPLNDIAGMAKGLFGKK
jgi:ATP phosphoribosyltransferase regulatory subunit HisZ